MGENVKFNELSFDDVIEMRVQRVDSILFDLDNIPDNDFVGNSAQVRESYKNELDQVKTLIRANIEGNNTMKAAYENLDKFYLKLDGLGDDDIIKPTSSFLPPTRDNVENVIISQSHSMGGAKDYLNLGRELNARPHVVPSPHPFEPIPSPKKQWDDKIPIDELVCKDKLVLAFKPEDPIDTEDPIPGDGFGKPLCLKPDTKEKWIESGVALRTPHDPTPEP